MSQNTSNLLTWYPYYEREGLDQYSLKTVATAPYPFCDTVPPRHEPFEPENWTEIDDIESHCQNVRRLEDDESLQMMRLLNIIFHDYSPYPRSNDVETYRKAALQDLVEMLQTSMFGTPISSYFVVCVDDYHDFNGVPIVDYVLTPERVPILALNRRLLNAIGYVLSIDNLSARDTPPLVALIAGLVFEVHRFRHVTPASCRTAFYTMVQTYLKGLGLGLSDTDVNPILSRIDFFCTTKDTEETRMVHNHVPSRTLCFDPKNECGITLAQTQH